MLRSKLFSEYNGTLVCQCKTRKVESQGFPAPCKFSLSATPPEKPGAALGQPVETSEQCATAPPCVPTCKQYPKYWLFIIPFETFVDHSYNYPRNPTRRCSCDKGKSNAPVAWQSCIKGLRRTDHVYELYKSQEENTSPVSNVGSFLNAYIFVILVKNLVSQKVCIFWNTFYEGIVQFVVVPIPLTQALG